MAQPAERATDGATQTNGGSTDGIAALETRRLLDYSEVVATERVPQSQRDRSRRWLLVVADVASVVAAFGITGFASPLDRRASQLLATLALWVLLNRLLGLYDRDATVIDKSTLHELPGVAESVAIGVVLIFLFGAPIGLQLHRYEALEFAAVAIVAMALSRSLVRLLVRHAYGPERALIVGSGEVARLIARKLRTHPSYGVDVIGCVDVAKADAAAAAKGPLVIGEPSRLHKLCREHGVERLIIAFSSLRHEHLLDTVRAAKVLGVKVTVVPRLFEVVDRSMIVDDIEGMSVLALRGVRTRSALALKRAIDVVVSALGLALLSPLLAIVAIAIKLDSRGPVIFSQVRIGRDNKPFRIRKFRTMFSGAESLKHQLAHLNQADFPMFKIADELDPRLTRVGRLLRRTMLDELPQLWNVLLGEMSLVGPRPLEPLDDEEVIGWHRARLELTPGLTGPWQALGRHSIPFREMVTLDYLYVVNWSLWNDLKLLFRTVFVVLREHRS